MWWMTVVLVYTYTATLFCSFVLSIREAAWISFLGLSTSLLFSDCRPREYKQILTGGLVLAEGLSPQVAYIHAAQKRQLPPNCLIGNHSLFFCFLFDTNWQIFIMLNFYKRSQSLAVYHTLQIFSICLLEEIPFAQTVLHRFLIQMINIDFLQLIKHRRKHILYLLSNN